MSAPDRFGDLNIRVRLPDGREGVLIGTRESGGVPLGRVLTDGYEDVLLQLSGLTVRRRTGTTVKFEGSRMYPIEAENIQRLHTAIWHSHWSNWNNGTALASKAYPYADWFAAWERGEKVPLPAEENLSGDDDPYGVAASIAETERRAAAIQTPAATETPAAGSAPEPGPPVRPQQLALF